MKYPFCMLIWCLLASCALICSEDNRMLKKLLTYEDGVSAPDADEYIEGVEYFLRKGEQAVPFLKNELESKKGRSYIISYVLWRTSYSVILLNGLKLRLHSNDDDEMYYAAYLIGTFLHHDSNLLSASDSKMVMELLEFASVNMIHNSLRADFPKACRNFICSGKPMEPLGSAPPSVE